MYKTISNKIIRQFKPCYDPSDVIKDETEKLPIKDWVQKYRNVVPTKDIIWLLSRKEFMPEKDLILFVVWCAREVLKLIENPDERIVEACNVAERYTNGEATKEELYAAHIAALNAAYYAARAAYYADADTYYAAATTIATANAVLAAANVARVAYYAALSAYHTANKADYDARDAARKIVRTAQIDKLLTYFE